MFSPVEFGIAMQFLKVHELLFGKVVQTLKEGEESAFSFHCNKNTPDRSNKRTTHVINFIKQSLIEYIKECNLNDKCLAPVAFIVI